MCCRSRRASTSLNDRGEVGALLRPAGGVRCTRLPMPIDALFESTIEIGHKPSRALAATCADCIVAESCAERLMHTMPSAPPSASPRKVSSNAPTDGADVSGSTDDDSSSRQNCGGAQLLAVDVLLVAEANREGNDLDVELVACVLRKIRSTVGDDAYGHGFLLESRTAVRDPMLRSNPSLHVSAAASRRDRRSAREHARARRTQQREYRDVGRTAGDAGRDRGRDAAAADESADRSGDDRRDDAEGDARPRSSGPRWSAPAPAALADPAPEHDQRRVPPRSRTHPRTPAPGPGHRATGTARARARCWRRSRRVDEERCAGVLARVEAAQREQVHGERDQPEREPCSTSAVTVASCASKPPRTSTATAGCARTASATDDGTTTSRR